MVSWYGQILAFAGNRGISKVEFSPDGGKIWLPAAVKEALGENAWRLLKEATTRSRSARPTGRVCCSPRNRNPRCPTAVKDITR
jgi:hypothetical protein